MISLKDYFKKKYKKFIQNLFTFLYGLIEVASENEIKKSLTIKEIKIEEITYNIFNTRNCRLFTTSIHDQSVIVNNKLITGPSFQLRVKEDDKLFARNNASINENIVLQIGTPRILKKIKGKVFSLLSGGAAKTNYFHWLFEVLPKLEILNRSEKIENIDYFLLPSIKMSHQLETLDLLNVPLKKLLDSNTYKHFICDELYVVDHPFRLTNNTVYDTQNIPFWIFDWLRKNFIKFKSSKSFPEKIFIERSKSISTHRNIKNKEEVYRVLKDNNFYFVKPENFGIKDQIKMFYSAKKIVGLHGAGFANICFCNPKTKIIEFKTNTTGMNSGNIALKNDLDYKGIICEAIGKSVGQQGQLIVPLEELKNKI